MTGAVKTGSGKGKGRCEGVEQEKALLHRIRDSGVRLYSGLDETNADVFKDKLTKGQYF